MKFKGPSKLKYVLVIILTLVLVFSLGAFTGWKANDQIKNQSFEAGKKAQRQEAIDLGYYQEDSKFLEHSPNVLGIDDWQKNEIVQSAWIPYWSFKQGTESYYKYANQFNSLSPVWYELKKDGKLENKVSFANDYFLKVAKANKTKVIPSVANFNQDEVKYVFENEEVFNRITNTLINDVDKYGFEGLDIDFEQINIENKDGYFRFLTKLSTELHKRNKLLTVAVLAKYTDLDVYSALKQTRMVMDYEKLGEIIDELRIMTYDYTAQGSYKPGPVAPIEWVESVVQYALTKLPAEKIMLGVPLYARSWSISGGTGTSNTYETIKQYVQDKTGTLEESTKENMIKVNINGDEKILWFNNKESVDYKRNLAKKYGLKGVVYWSLGNEDQKIWEN